MKKQHNYFTIIILFFVLTAIPTVYYFPRLLNLIHEPAKLLDLFLTTSNIKSFSFKFIFTSTVVFLSAALLDLCVMGWNNCALKRLFFTRNQSARGDLWCWLLSVFSLYDFFALLFSFGFFYVISSIIVKAGGFNLIQLIPVPILQFIVIFCLGDLKHYLWHRFMHKKPFWELHKYHHSATEFNLITTSRGHFIEKGFLIVFDSILFSLLGAPVEYFIAFIIIKEFYDQLLHSELNWSLGWVGRNILMSPKAHRIHHSDHHEFYDKNFGTMFIFWDKLFGTYIDTNTKITIGVDHNQYNKNGFWWDMLEGSRAFASTTKHMIKQKISSLKQ